jgi:hypothetical protein
MSDDQRMTAFVETWLKATSRTSYGTKDGVRDVMARVPQVRQRRRRWWALPLPGRAQPTTAHDITDDQHTSPIPATNSHAPTVIGRTTSMLSPAKAIAAGALVFAMGGAFLIAHPFEQQGSVPPAVETSEASEPTEFTAAFIPSASVRPGTYETLEGRIESRGNAWGPIISGMTDPRLDGRLTYSADEDNYFPSGSYMLGTATYRIANDDGAWQGSTPIFMDGSTRGPSVVLLVGEGAYKGLYAWMDTSDWSAIKGVIFPAPPPDAPEPPPDE